MINKTEQEIMKEWKGDISSPIVSVCTITYNHEKYIVEAINSFLMQETDFPFEVVIGEDCSTDGTRKIIEEYVEKYPNIIRLITSDNNIGAQKNFERTSNACRGKYIAICEGDDYWTDEKKLQIQATFLDKHNEKVISGCDAFIIDENGKQLQNSKLPDELKKDFTSVDLICNRTWVLTLNMMYRNIKFDTVPELSMVKNGDMFFTSLIGHYGGSHYHKDIKPSAYRVHSGGIWSKINDIDKENATINTLFWMYSYYLRKNEYKYSNYFLQKYLSTVIKRVSFISLIRELLKRTLFVEYYKEIIKKMLKKIGLFTIIRKILHGI